MSSGGALSNVVVVDDIVDNGVGEERFGEARVMRSSRRVCEPPSGQGSVQGSVQLESE